MKEEKSKDEDEGNGKDGDEDQGSLKSSLECRHYSTHTHTQHPHGRPASASPLSNSKQAEQLSKCRKFLHTPRRGPRPSGLVASAAFILAISFCQEGSRGAGAGQPASSSGWGASLIISKQRSSSPHSLRTRTRDPCSKQRRQLIFNFNLVDFFTHKT